MDRGGSRSSRNRLGRRTSHQSSRRSIFLAALLFFYQKPSCEELKSTRSSSALVVLLLSVQTIVVLQDSVSAHIDVEDAVAGGHHINRFLFFKLFSEAIAF